MLNPMANYLVFLLAASSGAGGVLAAAGKFDPLLYVDPLIGASNGGNVFAGASLPYGMAKAVADTNSQSNQGGFTLDGRNSGLPFVASLISDRITLRLTVGLPSHRLLCHAR